MVCTLDSVVSIVYCVTGVPGGIKYCIYRQIHKFPISDLMLFRSSAQIHILVSFRFHTSAWVDKLNFL